MATRVAAAMSLIVFTVCLIVGTNAGNPFAVVVERAMLGMAFTLVIGLVVGSMAQKMLDENIKVHEEKSKNDTTGAPQDGR